MGTLPLTGTPVDIRGRSHGDFRNLASIAQGIKSMLHKGNWDSLPNNKREALELIATKMARIVVGDYNFDDHWDDIKGYAELGKMK